MSQNAIRLNAEQSAAVALRNRTVFVSAAAGAGKTRVLVERLMAYLLEDERDIDEFLLITFTRAAAGEMRSRIDDRLRDLERKNPDNHHIREQLRRLPAARISTLDAYCHEIVSENAALLGLPAGYAILDEAQNESLRERMLEETLDALYEEYAADPSSPFMLCAEAYGDPRGDNALKDMLLSAWQKTRSHADPNAWLSAQPPRFAASDPLWERIVLQGDACRLGYFTQRYGDILEDLNLGGYAESYALTHQADLALTHHLLHALQQGWDAAAAAFSESKPATLARTKKGAEPDEAVGEAFKALRTQWKAELSRLAARYAAPLAVHEDILRRTQPQLEGFIQALLRFDELLWRQKLHMRTLDFSDIRRKALELLCPDGNPGIFSLQYGGRFHEIMVDEYQDINPMQNSLIDALCQEGKSIFYVGDVRQSIYRFQLAEPALFRERFAAARSYTPEDLTHQSGGPVRVVLRTNYRSHPDILNAVNHCFSRIDCPEMGVLPTENYLSSGKEDGAHQDNHNPAVEWLITPEDATEAHAVVARLRVLCDSGAYRPGDCVILLRSPGTHLRAYRQALEAAGLPCAGAEAGGYLSRPEIQTLRAALRAVDNARDDAALLGVLRSPILGCTPDELAALRLLGQGSLYDCLLRSGEPKLAAFRRQFARWRCLSAELPPYELAAELMADTRLPGLYGGIARENLLLFPELLRGYQGRSLGGLEDWLSRQEAKGAAPPRSGDASAAGVRIMSIHKSKGLEFPVVVAAHLGQAFNVRDQRARMLAHAALGLGPRCADEHSLYPTLAFHAVREQLDTEMRSEELRLLYVAMTRAVDKLIISGADDTKPLTAKPLITRNALAVSSCMGQWLSALRQPSWLSWQPQDQPADASALPIQAPTDPQANHILPPYAHAEASETPSKLTATGFKARLAAQTAEASAGRHYVLSERQPIWTAGLNAACPGALPVFRPRRPRFDGAEPPLTPAQKGTALHKFLQYARYEHCNTVQSVTTETQRLCQAALLTTAEAAVIPPEPIVRFFTGELGKSILTSGSLKREQRFSYLVQDGDIPGLRLPPGERVLMQGVIDCYFTRTDGGLVLVDFKTDRVTEATIAARAKSYAPQLSVYAAALEAITGRPVAQRVVYFFALNRVVEIPLSITNESQSG